DRGRGYWLTDVEVPQRHPILRMQRGEDALVTAGEDQSSGCREQASPIGARADLLEFPLELASDQVQGPYIQLARLIGAFDIASGVKWEAAGAEFFIGLRVDPATLQRREVKESGVGMVGGRHPIGSAGGGGAH